MKTFLVDAFLFIFCAAAFVFHNAAYAAPGDTIHVETIQFAGPQTGVYLFPPDSVQYQKVLINYAITCPCGQWDYLEYVNLLHPDPSAHDTVTYELLRFITPYGNGLNLGDRFTWTMDVTDFSPFLHDSVRLSAGNPQEAVDVSFDIITGTPPRKALGVEPLWNGWSNYGMQPPIDSFFVAKRLFIPPDAKGALLKITQTGHGFGGDTIREGDSIYSDDCAEFCGKKQNIYVNDTLRYAREVWRNTCGVNPVAAQGGTWVLNRSNWCPGSVASPFDYELTPFVAPGDSARVQIKMEPYTFVYNDSSATSNQYPHYDVTSYLVLYSAPNFANDAAIEDILSPTMKDEYRRHNPICAGPVIEIRNTGSNDLRTLDVKYGVKGGNHATYHWTSDLPFMQTARVQLPPFDWGDLKDTNTFEVMLDKPNGGADDYPPDNYAAAKFILPPLYYNNLEIRLYTNRYAAEQYAWTLVNAEDSAIASASQLNDNTLYIDSLYLPDGCYTFRLVNYWGYGLSWWATSQQLGSGWLKFTSLGAGEWSPSGDFGGELYQQFRVGAKPTMAFSPDTLDFGAVDTGSSKTLAEYITPQNSTGLIVSGISLFSIKKEFKIVSIVPPPDTNGDVKLAFGDTLAITVAFSPLSSGYKWGSLSMGTNDDRNPQLAIRLSGFGGSINAVTEPRATIIQPLALALEAMPNCFSDMSSLAFSANQSVHGRVSVVNVMGNEVAVLFDGMLGGRARSVELSAHGLPAGLYFAVLRSGKEFVKAPVVIVK